MNDAPRQNIWFTSAAQSSGPSAEPDCSSLCSLEPSWGENIFSFTSNVRNFRKRHHKDKKIRTPVSKVSAALGLFLGSHTAWTFYTFQKAQSHLETVVKRLHIILNQRSTQTWHDQWAQQKSSWPRLPEAPLWKDREKLIKRANVFPVL